MFYRKPHPWNPGYALPPNVLKEPPGRGTLTTKYRKRRSIGTADVPAPWIHGYALPQNVMDERVGGPPIVTKYTKRRTVSHLIPNPLGDDEGVSLSPGDPNDPIANFGRRTSAYVMRSIQKLPIAMRKDAMRSLFDQLDPKLWRRVEVKRKQLQRIHGLSYAEATERAIASAASLGLLEQIIAVGKGAKIKAKSALGIGAYGEGAKLMVVDGYMEQMSLGGWCGPVCLARKAGSGIKSGAKYTWSGVSSGAGTAYGWGSTAVNKIGSLACSASKSSLGVAAAGAGSTALGAGPAAGIAGAGVVRSACGSKGAPQVQAPPPAPPRIFPEWVLPVAVAGAAGLLVLAVTK